MSWVLSNTSVQTLVHNENISERLENSFSSTCLFTLILLRSSNFAVGAFLFFFLMQLLQYQPLGTDRVSSAYLITLFSLAFKEMMYKYRHLILLLKVAQYKH